MHHFKPVFWGFGWWMYYHRSWRSSRTDYSLIYCTADSVQCKAVHFSLCLIHKLACKSTNSVLYTLNCESYILLEADLHHKFSSVSPNFIVLTFDVDPSRLATFINSEMKKDFLEVLPSICIHSVFGNHQKRSHFRSSKKSALC